MSYIDKIVVDSTEYDVQDTDAQDKIERLKDNTKLITETEAITFIDGYYMKTLDSINFSEDTVNNSAWRYAVLECAPGDAFTITVEGGNTARPVGFYRSDYTLIKKADALTLNDQTVIAPADSAYLVINDKLLTSTCFIGVPVADRATTLEADVAEMDTLPLRAYKQGNGVISGTGETWVNVSSPSYKHIVVPVKPNDVVEIIGNSANALYLGFLKSYVPPIANNEAADPTTTEGFTGRITVSSTIYSRYVIPDDTHYVFLGIVLGGTDRMPTSFKVNGYDYMLSIAQNNVQTKEDMNAQFEAADVTPLSGLELHLCNINSNGTWGPSAGSYQIAVFPIKFSVPFSIEGGSTTLYAVLKSKPIVSPGGTIPYSDDSNWNSRKAASTTPSGILPEDAKYMAVSMVWGSTDVSPTSLIIDGIDYTKTVYDNMRNMAGDVGELQNTVSAVTSSAYEYTLYDCTSIGTAYTGYSGGPSGSPANAITMSQNASYDSYVFSVDRDTSVYVNPTGISYYALNVGVGGTGDWYSTGSAGALKHDFTSAVRYRTSGNNLPTIDNPLSISAGSMLVICVTAGKQPTIYMQDSSKTVKAKFGQILCVVGDTEITLSGTNYKAIWRKKETTQGYQWNLDDVIGQTKSVLSDNTDIVGVLRFTGQSNFMGGKHGNENVVSFKMLANGADIENGKSYEQVTVLMLSNLYDPDNTSTNPVDRIVEMTFRPDGWTSRVTFLIWTSATVDTAYPCGLFGFNAADADYCMTNVGVLDLASTASQPIANKDLKQLTVNLTDNATITIVGEEYDATPFVTYRSNTQSFKIYWPKARNLAVSSGDVITGVCHYYF